MFSVYVVDDDTMILDDIVQNIPWIDNGFQVIGHSTFPLHAIEDIIKLKPDVVFSDLKMPGLNGIEMIKILIEKGFLCEYIMLSAYGTFDDSRDFFRINGFDYILKPLQEQEVQIVLERLAKKLLQLKRTNETYEINEESRISSNPAFYGLIKWINKNYREKLSLNDLAVKFSLSSGYICNLFSKHYNTTFTRYITDLRMKEALRLMRETNKAYKEVSIDCGYSDYYYFCKVFKEYYSLSPTAYLKQNVIGERKQNGDQ